MRYIPMVLGDESKAPKGDGTIEVRPLVDEVITPIS